MNMKYIPLLVLLTIGVAAAAPTIYTDKVGIPHDQIKIWDTALGSLQDTTEWEHQNLYPGDYDAAVDAGLINWVQLCVRVTSITAGDEQVDLTFYDADGNPQDLGELHDEVNVFDLDPTWLGDTNQVKATINYSNSFYCDVIDDACVRCSKLIVSVNPAPPAVVPAPAAIVLGSIGSLMIAAMRSVKKRKS